MRASPCLCVPACWSGREYIRVWFYMCTSLNVCVYIFVCPGACLRICVFVTCVCACLYALICVRLGTCQYVSVWVTHACTYVHKYVCVPMCKSAGAHV